MVAAPTALGARRLAALVPRAIHASAESASLRGGLDAGARATVESVRRDARSRALHLWTPSFGRFRMCLTRWLRGGDLSG